MKDLPDADMTGIGTMKKIEFTNIRVNKPHIEINVIKEVYDECRQYLSIQFRIGEEKIILIN